MKNAFFIMFKNLLLRQLRSHASTHCQTSYIARTHSNAGPVATFRDSSPGAAEILDFWWPTSPKHLAR